MIPCTRSNSFHSLDEVNRFVSIGIVKISKHFVFSETLYFSFLKNWLFETPTLVMGKGISYKGNFSPILEQDFDL